MNFISHFYCHQTDSPYHNFGLHFPDFLGIVNREYKLTQFLTDYQGNCEEFLIGIKNHIRADEIWHSHIYFKEKTEQIKKVLADFEMLEKPYRPFFMTHVMLEILLDRAIILNEQQVAINMYQSLEKCDLNFLKALFVDEKSNDKFNRFFHEFLKNRYTLTYADNEMFIYALNRLFSRVNHPAINIAETDKFVSQLDEIVSKDYTVPLQEISNERIS